jgi:hypothetical protein
MYFTLTKLRKNKYKHRKTLLANTTCFDSDVLHIFSYSVWFYDYFENSINDIVRWNKTRFAWEKWYKSCLRPSELLDVMNVFEPVAYLEPILTLDQLNPTDSGRMYAQRTYFSSKRASPLQVYNIYHIESLKAKGFTILVSVKCLVLIFHKKMSMQYS